MAADYRIKVVGGKDFEPREWLRREVLWASLMTPYNQQLDVFIKGTAFDQHMGNKTRQDLFALDEDPESQSLAFFNQGKNVAGLISFAALFDACLDRTGNGAHVNIPGVQARSVDKVLARQSDLHKGPYSPDEEFEIFDESGLLVNHAVRTERGSEERNESIFRAGSMMTWLASAEAGLWLESSLQSIEGSLPELVIDDGGTPRSSGTRVDKLQPILHKILESANYRSFD